MSDIGPEVPKQPSTLRRVLKHARERLFPTIDRAPEPDISLGDLKTISRVVKETGKVIPNTPAGLDEESDLQIAEGIIRRRVTPKRFSRREVLRTIGLGGAGVGAEALRRELTKSEDPNNTETERLRRENKELIDKLGQSEADKKTAESARDQAKGETEATRRESQEKIAEAKAEADKKVKEAQDAALKDKSLREAAEAREKEARANIEKYERMFEGARTYERSHLLPEKFGPGTPSTTGRWRIRSAIPEEIKNLRPAGGEIMRFDKGNQVKFPKTEGLGGLADKIGRALGTDFFSDDPKVSIHKRMNSQGRISPRLDLTIKEGGNRPDEIQEFTLSPDDQDQIVIFEQTDGDRRTVVLKVTSPANESGYFQAQQMSYQGN